jgi:tRNA-splicing endonuclease subunit Sen54
MALKQGKKMIVVAAVDAGNISFYRFGQGAFEEWTMA